MITDGEFLIARAFDRNLDRAHAQASSTIAGKNRSIGILQAEVLRLQSELRVERGARKLAQLQLMRRN